jgi:hypothetical protein
MKYFYLYIFFLSILIILISFWNTIASKNSIEGFNNNNNKKNIILLGDSVLKNNAYVYDGRSIENLIIERNKELLCFAEDNATIADIFAQVNKLSIEMNNPNTFIFLSAGGNNILSHYVDQNQDITNTNILKPMFGAYKNLVKSIQNRLPKAKIILLDIYYPNNLTYKQFHSIINEWNSMIYDFADDPKNNIYAVIRISNHLTQNEDFSFGIEPSSTGGKKIADLILTI